MSNSRPERLTRVLLLSSLFGFFFRGYNVYSKEEHANGIGPLLDFVRGVGPAPFQYRVGVLRAAYWMYAHLHIPFRYGFALMDGVSSIIAVLLGYELLLRSTVFRRASLTAQWFGSAAYSALVLYLLAWQDWYKKNETEPSAALVMLIVFLWSSRSEAVRGVRVVLSAILILLLTAAQSLVRADVAFSLSIGMLAVALLGSRGSLSLPRLPALATAALGALLAIALQALLIKVIFTHARPYDGPVIMLPHDIGKPAELAEFLSYILPAVWTGWQVWRRRFTADAAGVGVLLACIPFIALWMLLGRIEEVRIFLPLGVALCPLSAQMAMLVATDTPFGEATNTSPAP